MIPYANVRILNTPQKCNTCISNFVQHGNNATILYVAVL